MAETKIAKKTDTKTVVKTIVQAEAKQVRIAPRKVDRVLKLIRGKSANEAMVTLHFLPHSGARYVEKVLKSAVANAENNNKLSRDNLYIIKAVANNGVMLKRFRAGGKGRAMRIKKYASHIVIALKEKGAK